MQRVKKIFCWNNTNTENNNNNHASLNKTENFNDSQSQDSELKLVIPQESLKKETPYNETAATTPEPSAGIHRNSHTSSPLYSRASQSHPRTPLLPSSRNSRTSSTFSINHSSNQTSNRTLNQTTTFEKYIAQYSYQAQQTNTLSFTKGDALVIINKKSPDWWQARLLATQQIGLVPSNHLQKADENSLNSKPWFFGKAGRREAERQLLMNIPENFEDDPNSLSESHLLDDFIGMYLVRESQTDENAYVLSILTRDEYQNSDIIVKHYKIIQDLEQFRFFITKKLQFSSITSLIEYYTNTPTSQTLIQQLAKPCPITVSFERGMGVWEIDRHTIFYKEKDHIGGGMFGDVYCGSWTTGETISQQEVKVAIKVLKQGRLKLEEFFKEATVMRSLRHPNLVQLHGVVSISEPVMIIIEFMANGSLVNYLRSHGDSLHNDILVDICCQISAACCYMEKHEFIHRDIRAANVLVGRNMNQCKLADFGLARCLKNNSEVCEEDEEGVYKPKTKSKFPIRWTSPEAALFHQFSVKSDVWSFGVFMYEVASRGKVPYAGMSNSDVLKEVPAGYRLQLNESASFPTVFNDIMQQCWIADPVRRPSFNHIFRKIHNLSCQ